MNTTTRISTLAFTGLTALGVLAGCGDDTSAGAPASDPAEVIEEYRIAYNDGDIDGVMALFSEATVVTDHPFADETQGLTAIRSLQLDDMAFAAPVDAYEFSDVTVDGELVTWNSRRTNRDGIAFCADGQKATVERGRIVTWTFAPDPYPCDDPTG